MGLQQKLGRWDDGTKCWFVLGRESVHRHVVCEHSGECGNRGLNGVPNDCRDLRILHDKDDCRARQSYRRESDHHVHLVFDGSGGRGAHDLTESKHATSADSSDAFRRAGHHCEGDENVHCDDDGESREHNGEGLSDYGGEELCGHNGDLFRRSYHEHAVEYVGHGPGHAGVPLSHDHVCLNGLCNGDGGTDYVLQGLGAYAVRCEHSVKEQTLQGSR